MMTTTRRAAAGAALLLWAGGMTTLARRVHAPPPAGAEFTEAATRFNPGAVYYLVERDGRQIGFASTTADTAPSGGIRFADYLVIEARADANRRMAVTAMTEVTRGFAFQHTEMVSDTATGTGWSKAVGDLEPDSTVFMRALFPQKWERSDRADRTLLAPDVIPMIIGMGTPATPRVGSEVTYRVVDAAGGRIAPVTFRIAAESLFAIADSAVFDSTAMNWRAAVKDTVRAWKVEPNVPILAGMPSLSAWVDGQGRVVDAQADIAGAGTLRFRRMCYELAYRNWPGRRFK